MKTFPVLDPTLLGQVGRGFCALAVMTKAPQAGLVKTRLVPLLTPDEAAELNRSFLRDTAAAISNACCRRPVGDAASKSLPLQGSASHREAATTRAMGIAVYTPVGSEPLYTDILPNNYSLFPQRGEKFGERLYFAAEDLFKCGFDSVCLIDSDSPTVPAENFATAVELLNTSDDRVVLGPCEDGGYYLIGLTKPHRELFEQIDFRPCAAREKLVSKSNCCRLDMTLTMPRAYAACATNCCATMFGPISPRIRESLYASSSRRRSYSGVL